MTKAKCFKADSGAEENGITPTLVGDHNNRVSDQSVIILEPLNTTEVHRVAYGFDPHAAMNVGCMLEENSITLTQNAPMATLCPSYGVTAKGDGSVFLSEERHTSLSQGGGQAGQGFPCVCAPDERRNSRG